MAIGRGRYLGGGTTPAERRVLGRLHRSLHDRGLVGTCRTAGAFSVRMVQDIVFDVRAGIWTQMPSDLSRLTVVGDPAHGTHYAPTHARVFLRSLAELGVPPSGCFVDVGCGKGRALVLALHYGFDCVVGVEFAGELASEAEATLARYERRGRAAGRWRVEHRDARTYTVRSSDTLFYLFNPFDAEVLQAVLANILSSRQLDPRGVGLVYANPVHRQLLDDDPEWTLVAVRHDPGLFDWLYYRAGGP